MWLLVALLKDIEEFYLIFNWNDWGQRNGDVCKAKDQKKSIKEAP